MKTVNVYTAYLFLEGGRGFLYTIIFAASGLYQVSVVGLTPLQLVLVGTLLESVYFIFQIPTGVIADVYSRKWSVIIGFSIIGIGFFIEGWFPTFAAVLTAMVLWGIGATFVDGALEAWITDEIGADGASRAFMREGQIGNALNILGVMIAVGLGSVFALATPIWMGGALLIVLAGAMVFVMPETGFKPTQLDMTKPCAPLRIMRDTFTLGMGLLRGKPLLVTLTLISLLNGLFSEGLDRLRTVHLVRTIGFPVVFGIAFQEVQWMGFIQIVTAFLSIFVVEAIRRRLDSSDGQKVARWLFAGTVTMALVFWHLLGPIPC